MNDDLASTIKILKGKLTNLEDNYEFKLKEVEMRELKDSRLNSKAQDLLSIQNHILTFNIGGEKYKVSKYLILNSIYNNILKDVISSMERLGRGLDELQSVFIDRNPKTFLFITEIMRKSYNYSIKNNFSDFQENSLKLILPKDFDLLAFKSDLIYYFKDDYEKVMNDFQISKYNSRGETIELPNNSVIMIKYKIDTSLPGENLDPYRATSLKDIKSKDSNKAFFVSYDSNIQFELKETMNISSIELKPFFFDYDAWIPSEGAGTFIFSSIDNVEWDFLNSVPDDYGLDNDLTYLILFEERKAKYIKFQTGEFTLSISYIKIS